MTDEWTRHLTIYTLFARSTRRKSRRITARPSRPLTTPKLADMPLDDRTKLVSECFEALPAIAKGANLVNGQLPDDPLAKPLGALTLAILERLGNLAPQVTAGKLLNV